MFPYYFCNKLSILWCKSRVMLIYFGLVRRAKLVRIYYSYYSLFYFLAKTKETISLSIEFFFRAGWHPLLSEFQYSSVSWLPFPDRLKLSAASSNTLWQQQFVFGAIIVPASLQLLWFNMGLLRQRNTLVKCELTSGLSIHRAAQRSATAFIRVAWNAITNTTD